LWNGEEVILKLTTTLLEWIKEKIINNCKSQSFSLLSDFSLKVPSEQFIVHLGTQIETYNTTPLKIHKQFNNASKNTKRLVLDSSSIFLCLKNERKIFSLKEIHEKGGLALRWAILEPPTLHSVLSRGNVFTTIHGVKP